MAYGLVTVWPVRFGHPRSFSTSLPVRLSVGWRRTRAAWVAPAQLPRRTEGQRCDLVVTPGGLPLVDDRSQLDLFAPKSCCPLGEALWIEVKVIAQFAAGGPNRGYSGALQAPVWRDAERPAADEGIRHAAQIVVLFTADEGVAAHAITVGRRDRRSA